MLITVKWLCRLVMFIGIGILLIKEMIGDDESANKITGIRQNM